MGISQMVRSQGLRSCRSVQNLLLQSLFWLAFVACFLIPQPVRAARAAVQEIIGRVETGERLVYTLPDLKKGQTLYAYAQGTSGNLDPFLVLVRPGTDIPALRQAFTAELEKTLAAGGIRWS